MALDETTIRHLVLTELARQGSKYVPVGISARHVHLTAADIERLFGPGYQLTPIKPLVQPGQFASKEQVTLVGPRGQIAKVRILGPARSETQVEVSLSDAMKLGVKDCPVRMSGDLAGTPGIRIVGPQGEIEAPAGVIAAARHLHLTDDQARAYGVHNGQVVAVRITGPRPCLMENVVCRCGSAHELELHVDTDEANACCLRNGDLVELVIDGEAAPQHHQCKGTCRSGGGCTCGNHCHGDKPGQPEPELLDLVIERNVNDAFREGRKQVLCARTALVTPAAADRAEELGIEIRRADTVHIPAPAAPAAAEREVLDLVTERSLNDAYRDNLTEIYCTKDALITDAAADRAEETGIRIIRAK